MLRPRNMKYRKRFKNIRSVTERDHLPLVAPTPWTYRYGLYSADNGIRLTDRQIETMRQFLARKVARSGGYKIRVFPQIPVTRKPVGARMGGGKGSTHHFVAFVKKGAMLAEFDTDASFPWAICKGLSYLMPVDVKWVDRKDLGLPLLPRPVKPVKKEYLEEEEEETNKAATAEKPKK